MRGPSGRVALCRAALLAASVWTAASKASAGGGESARCEGSYDKPVANLCPSHWPDAQAKKVWIVAFYAPWCGHCRSLENKYLELAQQLRESPEVGLGAIDCSPEAHRDTCRRYGIAGYPTIKAIVSGKTFASYNGQRETAPMLEWIKRVLRSKGTRGGSAKCTPGLFHNKAEHAVVPLCEAHFPDSESKNAWLVVFYDREAREAAEVQEATAEAGRVLGNEPPAIPKQARKKRLTQRDRATKLAKKYGLELRLPKEGLSKKDTLVRVGAVCCDCEGEDSERFCGSVLGTLARAGALRRPAAVWADGIDNKGVRVRDMEAKKLVKFALERLGVVRVDDGGPAVASDEL